MVDLKNRHPSEPLIEMLGSIFLLIWVMVLFVLFYGVMLFSLQVYNWLYYGFWVEIPLLSLFIPVEYKDVSLFGIIGAKDVNNYIPNFLNVDYNSWLLYPSKWIGLHKIVIAVLEFIPLSLATILSSVFSFYVLSKFDKNIS